MYSVENGEQFNGTWKIDGRLVLNYWDDGTVGKVETTYFQNGTWNYTGLGDGIQYSATKVSTQPSVIPLIYFNINRTPASPVGNVINVTQLVGHWKATTSNNETLEFNIYPDQRAYTVDNNGSQNTCWTIKNEYFLSYKDYLMPSELAVLKTTFFDGKTWKYESLENGIKFTATKTGNIPKKIAQKVQPQGGGTIIHETTCSCCRGAGIKDCPICYGEGGKNERVARNVWNPNTNSHDTEYYNVWYQCEYCQGKKT
ncbi:MAG: hypothetical protein HC905_25115 [Bacteroidales bacterium]|nr:hypothetical protein [Bacteroidales bacterium]